ncbi:MAG: type 4a pilus biogenesis protein PilO [Candidatus Omnitrophota bacterium]
MDLSKNIDIASIMEKQRIIIPVIILILSLVVGNKIYKNRQSEINATRDDIKQGKIINDLIEVIADQEDVFSRYQDKFYPKEPAEIMREISDAAAAAGIRVFSFDPRERIKTDALRISSFRLKVRGGYHNIGDFIASIESLDDVLTIDSFKLSYSDRLEKDGLDADILIKAVFSTGEKSNLPLRRKTAQRRRGVRAWQKAIQRLEGDNE